MALSILDGNQTATTLSTVVSAGAHIPAHTVVSLGSQAITDMRSAVSGSVVSISNLPATQTVAGTVTANVSGQYYSGSGNEIWPISVGKSGESFNVGLGRVAVELVDKDGNSLIENSAISIGIRGTVTANVPNLLTQDQEGKAFYGVAIGYNNENDDIFHNVSEASPLPVAGTVTANVTNSITVGSLPVQLSTTTIGGTARLNVTLSSATTVGGAAPSYANLYGGSDGTNLRAISVDTSGRTVVTGSVNLASTTVTVSALPSIPAGTAQIGSVTASITGTVPVSIASVTIGAFPRPTWTDYSGTIVTAGTAVTAISTTTRSYLLAQVTTGQMFINIGSTATTLNSVYFSAGQGFAWETSVPQGIVSIISSVTGTNYVLKDG